jgi:hypothetical protein
MKLSERAAVPTRQLAHSELFTYFVLQLSATIFTEVTSSVLVAVAVAVAPVDPAVLLPALALAFP